MVAPNAKATAAAIAERAGLLRELMIAMIGRMGAATAFFSSTLVTPQN